MSGLPCIRDTWVTVSATLGQLAAGRSIEEILVDYPYLERDDVLAALEFAAAAVGIDVHRKRSQVAVIDQVRWGGWGSNPRPADYE
jgi:uncharacterized protein (DUF433 family)